MRDIDPNAHHDADDIDPALVEAMRSRVVKRKTQDYGKRKAGPGRPKGCAKIPGSGKKAGTPNVMTPEFRQWLSERAKPFEVLAAICAGEEIADSNGKRKPTVQERMRAAETLTRKLLPDLAATSLSGPDGGPLAFQNSANGHANDRVELARRVAFMLSSGLNSMHPEPGHASTHPPVATRTIPAADISSEPPDDDDAQYTPGHSEQVGRATISFAERLPGGRDRWAIRDENGRLVGAAFGRDAAETKARTINEDMQ